MVWTIDLVGGHGASRAEQRYRDITPPDAISLVKPFSMHGMHNGDEPS